MKKYEIRGKRVNLGREEERRWKKRKIKNKKEVEIRRKKQKEEIRWRRKKKETQKTRFKEELKREDENKAG